MRFHARHIIHIFISCSWCGEPGQNLCFMFHGQISIFFVRLVVVRHIEMPFEVFFLFVEFLFLFCQRRGDEWWLFRFWSRFWVPSNFINLLARLKIALSPTNFVWIHFGSHCLMQRKHLFFCCRVLSEFFRHPSIKSVWVCAWTVADFAEIKRPTKKNDLIVYVLFVCMFVKSTSQYKINTRDNEKKEGATATSSWECTCLTRNTSVW